MKINLAFAAMRYAGITRAALRTLPRRHRRALWEATIALLPAGQPWPSPTDSDHDTLPPRLAQIRALARI